MIWKNYSVMGMILCVILMTVIFVLIVDYCVLVYIHIGRIYFLISFVVVR